MNNSVINFKKEIINNYEVSDYRSLNLDIDTSKYNMKSTNISEKTLIECLSNTIYKNPDYWDLLLLINKKDALFDMVYDFDSISDICEDITNEYFGNNYQGNKDSDFIEAYKENLKSEYSKENFNNSFVKYPQENEISDIIRKIKHGI